ncbi:MAG: hypothetical protein ACLQVL_37320 [Terriglobia bacterium]
MKRRMYFESRKGFKPSGPEYCKHNLGLLRAKCRGRSLESYNIAPEGRHSSSTKSARGCATWNLWRGRLARWTVGILPAQLPGAGRSRDSGRDAHTTSRGMAILAMSLHGQEKV